MKTLLAISVFLIFSQLYADVVNDPATGQQVRASCDYYDVAITKESDFEDYFYITTEESEPTTFGSVEPFWGPDRESYLKLLKPDLTKPPPDYKGWNFSMFINTATGNSFLVQITSGRGTVKPFWRTKDTIQVEVWRGRIAESVFLVNAVTGEIVSAESRNHFEQILRCLGQ